MHTGTAQFVRPSLGAWTLYGLGTENSDVPGFVALNPAPGTARHYGSAFLPAIYSGTTVGSGNRGGGGNRPRRDAGAPSVPDRPMRVLFVVNKNCSWNSYSSLTRANSNAPPLSMMSTASLSPLS